jgi:hypothetical protein
MSRCDNVSPPEKVNRPRILTYPYILPHARALPLLQVAPFATPHTEHFPLHPPALLPICVFERSLCKFGDEDGLDPIVEVFEPDDGRVAPLGNTDIGAGIV